jgi:ribose transport system ATP-binding protein
MAAPRLSMQEITKSFPGVQALDRASLEVSAGECHALVGENGAGKSTLMKVLAGAVIPDSGRMLLDGQELEPRSPLEARRAGISMIYQELNLLPELTVAENIFLGREPRRVMAFLDRPRMVDESRRWLERLGQAIDPRRPARDLSLAEQQMVEIAKAVSLEARVMVMDEPSAILTDRELEDLFRLMAALRRDGLAIIYISHRLDEVFRVSERVTVMRDGKTIATHDSAQVSHGELVREMVGRELARIFPERQEPRDETMLEVKNLSRGRRVRGVSLRVRSGEIVGLAGLVGAGRSDVARIIFGAEPSDSGEILFQGKPLARHTPHEAIRRGIGFLTEDRKGQGLLVNMSVRENVTIAALAALARRLWLSRHGERAAVQPLVEQLRIKTAGLEAPIVNLSGGNQQKAILARWLFTRSRFLIFDEPTRGIDVGAKAEIYRLIAELAAEGRGILVISSELPEILGLCHRIYVMREGEVAGEVAAAEATQETLLATAMGVA